MATVLVITLIGLVLAVLIPPPANRGRGTAKFRHGSCYLAAGTVMLAAAGTGRGDLVIRS